MDEETRNLLRAGKLEKTCRACGRWEAASPKCSWCQTPSEPADWYRNNDLDARYNRLPAVAPANPPSEFRRLSAWPPHWGHCPYQKAASPRTGPQDNDTQDGDE